MLVPKTDADGNDVAGIRLPAVAVPTATYTGWALRAAAFAGDDLCDASGQQIAFLHAKADRPRRRPAALAGRALPDPRAVREALRARGEASQHQPLLLPEDARALATAANAAPVP